MGVPGGVAGSKVSALLHCPSWVVGHAGEWSRVMVLIGIGVFCPASLVLINLNKSPPKI